MIKTLFSNIIISLALLFFLSPTNSPAGQANLAWDPPDISTDVTGYLIHHGTASGTYSQDIDVGNTTSYTVSNLIDGQTYYFAVTAYNDVGYQSVYSNEVSIMMSNGLVDPSGPGGSVGSQAGGDGGGGCFIATAAYGSYLDPHVQVLRYFRDHYLMTHRPGKAFVGYYYSVSPPIASYIKQHEPLRTVTRFILTPIVYGLEYPWLVMIFGGVVIGIGIIIKRKRLNVHVEQ